MGNLCCCYAEGRRFDLQQCRFLLDQGDAKIWLQIQWRIVAIVTGCALFVMSHSRFRTNVLAKFFDTMHVIIHAVTHSPFRGAVLKKVVWERRSHTK